MTSVQTKEKTLIRIYLGAKRYIRIRGLTAEAFDEFAAFAVINYIDNGFKMMSYDIVFVDFMRCEFGRIKQKSTQLKNSKIEFDDEIHSRNQNEEDCISNLLTLEKMYEMLNDREKKIMTLLTYGFSQVDIANKFNISESRVSQLVKQMIGKLSHHLNDKD